MLGDVRGNHFAGLLLAVLAAGFFSALTAGFFSVLAADFFSALGADFFTALATGLVSVFTSAGAVVLLACGVGSSVSTSLAGVSTFGSYFS